MEKNRKTTKQEKVKDKQEKQTGQYKEIKIDVPVTQENIDEQTDEETKEKFEQTNEEQVESLQIDKLEEQINQLKEQNLRQFAEFDNYRKRTQREKQETYKNAAADCALDFIVVLDNLERAVESSNEESEIKTGVEMIVTQFYQVLEKMDIHQIEALNQPFDPELHNAVNQVEDENYGENTVCQVLQKGYHMGEKVLRPSMVVVANP